MHKFTAEEIAVMSGESRLRAEIGLRVMLTGDMLRAELRYMRPGEPGCSRLVWQHYAKTTTPEETPLEQVARAFAQTAEWLHENGLPGVRS